MEAPTAVVLGMLLAAGAPAAPGRVGEGLAAIAVPPALVPAHTLQPAHSVSAALAPDTSRRPAPDTLRPRPALTPDAAPAAVEDDDKPTRKTVLFAALAMAVLTISTLLLYNVRSR